MPKAAEAVAVPVNRPSCIQRLPNLLVASLEKRIHRSLEFLIDIYTDFFVRLHPHPNNRARLRTFILASRILYALVELFEMFFGNNHGSKLKQKTRSSSTRAHTDFCAEITALGPDQLDSNSRILADSAYHSVDDDEKYVVEGCSTSSSADEENFIQNVFEKLEELHNSLVSYPSISGNSSLDRDEEEEEPSKQQAFLESSGSTNIHDGQKNDDQMLASSLTESFYQLAYF